MLTKKPAVVFKAIIAAAIMSMGSGSGAVYAATHFHLDKDDQGLIRPFKAVSIPLADFVREYARVTSTAISVGGSWDQELQGQVTLFMRHSLKPSELTEVLYRVTGDNGYAVLDAPAGNGWVIQKVREARDQALPTYELAEVPDSARLVTAYHHFKYVDAEMIARMARGFMPAGSRIVPTFNSVIITDVASNIRKLNLMILRFDTEEIGKRQRSGDEFQSPPPRVCGEHHIDKLVVEKLEIQNGNGNGQNFTPTFQPTAMQGAANKPSPEGSKEGSKK